MQIKDNSSIFDRINADWNFLLSGAFGGLMILVLNILYARIVDWWN
jgi:hypothetical protein